MKKAIRIGVVDDHTLFRSSFIQALAIHSNFSVIIESPNGIDLLNQLQKNVPDVLLLDIRMPKPDGIECLAILQEKYPAIKILVLSSFLDEVYVTKSLEFGIHGYLTKSMEIQEIMQAIECAYNNSIYTNNLLNNSILRSYIVKFNKTGPNVLPDFSPQEIELLNCLKDEMTTNEIADRMNISQRSVEIKRDKMRKKANVKTIAGLLIYAIKRGLIPIETEIKI